MSQTTSQDRAGEVVEEIDQRLVRHRLTRAGWPPAAARAIYAEIGARLLDSLRLVRVEPALVIDCSAATASLASQLAEHYRAARVVSIDVSQRVLTGIPPGRSGWLRRNRQGIVCADTSALPFADSAAHLLVSNLALHRRVRPDGVLAEAYRVLAPNGLLMLSTFGPDTLVELRDCWRSIDDDEHVHPFADMHDLGDALVRTGFSDVVMSAERLTCHFPDLATLHQDLRLLGVSNASPRRPRSLRTSAQLARVEAAYERLRRPEGVPVTLELLYAHGWRPEPRSMSVNVPFPPRGDGGR